MLAENKDLKTDVLINGAGPTGLMMACHLALHKIPFRIIDKKQKRENYSGAMIIHARSMEIFHQMGISLKILKEGVIARKINFQFNYRTHFSIDIADFGNGWSLFPYILILEQSKTEKLLISFLNSQGYEVEAGTALLSFSQKRGIVTSVLKNPSGIGEVVKTKFLIGAGGSTSLVRRQLKIPFYGITHPDLLFVSDSQADIFGPKSDMAFTFTKNQTLGFFPLPRNRWRIDGAIPDLGKISEKITFDFIDNYLNNDRKLNIQLVNSTWFSVFRSHSRYAPAFKHHHCFLIGDAAHIHSPVGAQGMNTGLQDAYNLAWKLAFYLKGSARANILETYQEERLPVARSIIEHTDTAYRWITDNRSIFKFIRLNVLPVLIKILIFLMIKIKWVKKSVFLAISGTGIDYKKSSLSRFFNRKPFFDNSPLPGERLPSLQYFLGNNIYQLQEQVKYTSYHLFVFGVKDIPENLMTVVEKFSPLLEAQVLPVDPGTDDIYKRMVNGYKACYLVRPDLYIAWRSDYFDATGLENYLKKFLVPAYEFKAS